MLNPGAWTHYAWAIRDALEIAGLPAVEVHLSDVSAREPWRRTSVIGELCFATVSGRGPDGYGEALALLRERLERSRTMSAAQAAALHRAQRAARRAAARAASSTRCSSASPVNLRYLSGFTGSNGLALICAAGAGAEAAIVFFTDFRYTTQSAEQVPQTFEREIVTGEPARGAAGSLEGVGRPARLRRREHDRRRSRSPGGERCREAGSWPSAPARSSGCAR